MAAIAALGCTSSPEPTQLVVVVSSDYPPEVELAYVDAERVSPAPSISQRRRIVTREPEDGESVTLPFSFGVRPPNGDASAKVELLVSALDAQRQTLVRRRVRVGFVKNQTRLLRIDLTRDCADLYLSCEPAQTCQSGECVDIDVDVSTLPRVRSGDELHDVDLLECTTCDAGEMDADAPSDMDAADTGATHDSGDDSGDDSGHDSGHDTGLDPDGEVDGSDVEPGCGAQPGYFADVARPLIRTANGTLCPSIAVNAFVETGDALQVASNALTDVNYAITAGYDFFELGVAMSGSTLYATGQTRSLVNVATLPTLEALLGDAALADDSRPLVLTVTGYLGGGSANSFASALLDLLSSLANAPYAKHCRPLYLFADGTPVARAAVLATHQALTMSPSYAGLLGHMHFGDTLGPNVSPNDVDAIDSGVIDVIALDFATPGVLSAASRARSRGLAVFLRNANVQGLAAALCGSVDALLSLNHGWSMGGTTYVSSIAASQTLIDLNVASLTSVTTQISYGVGGSTQNATATADGQNTPTLSISDSASALPGAHLDFTPSSTQALPLVEAELPINTRRYAGLAIVHFNTTPASGERQVIASARTANAGWSLALVDGLQLRLEIFLRDAPPASTLHNDVMNLSLPTPLAPNNSYTVLFGVGTYVQSFVAAIQMGTMPLIPYSTLIEANDAVVTLGSDPDGAGDFFDGQLQAFKLIAY